MTVYNTCQVCERTIYVPETAPTACSLDGPAVQMEVGAFLAIGDWSRSYTICSNCAARLIAELDSFVHDSRAFTQLTLGELQDRMDSVAREAPVSQSQEKGPVKTVEIREYTPSEREEVLKVFVEILKNVVP